MDIITAGRNNLYN